VIHNARRALSMEERSSDRKKKHAMADLARAISHDVKNAIGAILPLAQQAREEVEAGTAKPAVLAQDLLQIEQSAQICQRIFDGMLQLARSENRPRGAAAAEVLEGYARHPGTRMKRAPASPGAQDPDDLPRSRDGAGSSSSSSTCSPTRSIRCRRAAAQGQARAAARAWRSASPHRHRHPPSSSSGSTSRSTRPRLKGSIGLAILPFDPLGERGEMSIDSHPAKARR